MPFANRYLRGIDATLRTVAITTVVLLAAWILQSVLLLIFAAVLVACVLRGAANWLHARTGLREGWCLLIVTVLIGLALGFGLWMQGPRVAEQVVTVADTVNQQARHLWDVWQDNAIVQRMVPQLQEQGNAIFGRLTSLIPSLASSLIGIGGDLVVVLATAIFFAISPRTYVRGILHLLPPHWRPRGQHVMDELGSTLQFWFVGQFFDMVVVAILTGTGLFFLGVPLSLTLALIAGLFNFVPYIGAISGAVPALAVAVAQSPHTALYVAILYVIVQTLEGNVVAPLIQRRTVDLPPALTILSQTVLGSLFGVMGLILATPLTAASMTAVRMIYVESVLEHGASSVDT